MKLSNRVGMVHQNIDLIMITGILCVPEIIWIHPYMHDTTGWIYPIRKWFVREIHDGYFPGWINIARYGWATTELQSAAWVWSPIAVVIGLFTDDFNYQMLQVEFLSWRLMALFGVYAWIRQTGRRFTATIASIAYVYSYNFIDLEKQITIYIGYSLVPWLLYAAAVLAHGRGPKYLYIITSVIIIILTWSSYPAVWIVVFGPIVVYAMCLIGPKIREIATTTTLQNSIVSVGIISVGVSPLLARVVTSGLFGGAVRANGWSPNEGALSDLSVATCFLGSWGMVFGLPRHYCLGEYSTIGILAIIISIFHASIMNTDRIRHYIATISCALIIYGISNEHAIGELFREKIPVLSQMRWYSIHGNLLVLTMIQIYSLSIENILSILEKYIKSYRHASIFHDDRRSERLDDIGGAAVRATQYILVITGLFYGSWKAIGYSSDPSTTWDWSRQADKVMSEFRSEYSQTINNRLVSDTDRNILNLIVDVPHFAFYRGLLPELETVDRYWGSPTLFREFLMFPVEWYHKSEKDVTISREAMRGEYVAHRESTGWSSRVCDDRGEDADIELKLTNNRSTEIEGTISTPCTGMAIWMDTYDEGWSIRINDEKQALFRINNAVRGFIYKPGVNRFVMRYSGIRAAWKRLVLLARA